MGQLGHGAETMGLIGEGGDRRQGKCSTMRLVNKLRGRTILAVAAGKSHSLAVTTTLYETPGDIEIWSWGDGDSGQLG